MQTAISNIIILSVLR